MWVDAHAFRFEECSISLTVVFSSTFKDPALRCINLTRSIACSSRDAMKETAPLYLVLPEFMRWDRPRARGSQQHLLPAGLCPFRAEPTYT